MRTERSGKCIWLPCKDVDVNETVILRKVLKPRLIMVFTAVVAVGIITVGYLFNLLI